MSYCFAIILVVLSVGRAPLFLLFREPAELGFFPQTPMEKLCCPRRFPPGAKGMATGGDILHPPTACACACVCIAFHSVYCPGVLCLYLPLFAVLSQLPALRGPLWTWSVDLGNPHPLSRLVSPSSAPLGSVAPHAARVRRVSSMDCFSLCPLMTHSTTTYRNCLCPLEA